MGRAVYQPKTPVWAVLGGFLAVWSALQYFNQREQAKTFETSPELRKPLEEEYVRHCSRGRQGYQSGELTKERKAEIKAAFLRTLEEDPDCPYQQARWSNTIVPTLLYHLPVKMAKCAVWRVSNNNEIQGEKDRAAE